MKKRTARRLLLGLSAWLLFAGVVCLSQAQPQFGFPPGTFQNRAALDAGAPAYVGPGDLTSGAVAYWSTSQCYNTAYSGNMARVRSPLDALTSTITCAAGGIVGVTGTALATTCAVSCTVDILYDQSGAASCSGACDAANATEAGRPLLILNCQGGKTCMEFAGAQKLTTPSLGSTFSQPNWISAAAIRTGAFTTTGSWFGDARVCSFSNSADTMLNFAGSSLTATAADNAWHAVQCVQNGTSSELYVDGVSTVGDAGTQSVGANAVLIGNDSFNDFITGRIGAVGFWNIAPNGTQNSNMNANQHAFWGF